LFFVGKNWSTGVVGLVAGRIKDKYYKPTLIMAENDGEITGSGRSIAEFNLIGALQEIPEYFDRFGGHPMACGFTLVSLDKLEPFKQALIEKFKEKTTGLDIAPTLEIDCQINLAEVNWELYDLLNKFEPFGQANERPKYLAANLTVVNIEGVGKDKKHLRLMVKTETGKTKKIMGWNLCNGETNWCKLLQKGDKIDVVFEISVNEWNGNRELQLTIVDLKKSVQIS
jgi:single-stranded-DNA-specific exonuclease